MSEDVVALTIRIPAKLKHRATVAAAREGISINAFIQRLLDAACPQANPFSDTAHQLATLALQFDEDAPQAQRVALIKAMRASIAEFDAAIEAAPIHEPDWNE